MSSPTRDTGWIWATLSEAVFDFRHHHGALPALIRVPPETYLLMAREAKSFRVHVAGVPVQPDSDLPSGDYSLDRTRRARNPL